MQRTLTVDGYGKLTLLPDHVSFVFEPSYHGADTAAASDELALSFKKLQSHLLQLGIQKEEIKSSNFSVKPHLEYNKSTLEHEINGYAASQTITVKVAREKKLIAALLDTTNQHLRCIPFRFHFVLSDEKKYMGQLIALAVNDAKTKAEMLAEAAELRLGSIASIKHTKQTDNFIYSAATHRSLENEDVFDTWDDDDFQPEETELDTEVTIVWELKD